jgi:DNA modification methylase
METQTLKPYYQDEYVTIYHGDCREILPSLAPVDLLLTDPPYGIKYVHGAALGPNASRFSNSPIVGDNEPFDPAHLLQLGVPSIIWGGNNFADRLPTARAWLIWDKRCNTTVNHQSDCEIAWTSDLTQSRIFYHVWDGFRRQTEKGTPRVHPMQKPVALMSWCLGLAPKARTVLDPYMGSGTTLRAAKDLGLKAIGIEIEEKYCEIAARRMAQQSLLAIAAPSSEECLLFPVAVEKPKRTKKAKAAVAPVAVDSFFD